MPVNRADEHLQRARPSNREKHGFAGAALVIRQTLSILGVEPLLHIPHRRPERNHKRAADQNRSDLVSVMA